MTKREYTDIDGRKIEVGDLILIPKNSSLAKAYVLSFTEQGINVSCKKITRTTWKDEEYTSIDRRYYLKHQEHDEKQYIQWIGEIYIIEKNADVPAALLKYIKR